MMNNIATHLSEIQADTNTIRDKYVELGIAQPTDGLDKLAAASESIENRGAVSATLTVDEPSYTVPEGYHSGEGVVKIVTETKTATPTKTAQNISASEGKVLSGVTVEAIPDNYIDTTDADATAGQILADRTAYVNGEKVTGSMPSNGDVGKTLDGLTTTSVEIPTGYTTGGTVSLTDDIEKALAAIRGVAV